MAGKLWGKIGPEAVILIVIFVGIGGYALWDGGYLEPEPDATWTGKWAIERHDTGDLLRETITVTNVGDDPFPVRAEDWHCELNGKQYAPNIVASYFRGFTEVDVIPGLTHTFVLLYDVPKGLQADECVLYYMGDKNVQFGG